MKKATFFKVLLMGMMVLLIFSCKKNTFGSNTKSIGLNEVILNNELNNIKARWVVLEGGSNLTETADESSSVIAFVPFMAKVFFVENVGPEKSMNGKTGQWTKVEWNGKAGWIFGGYLSKARPYKISELGLDMPKNKLIINTWKNNEQTLALLDTKEFTFMENGKESKGTWELNTNNLLLTYTEPADKVLQLTINDLNARNMVAVRSDNSEVITMWADAVYTDLMESFVPFNDNTKHLAVESLDKDYFYGNWTGKELNSITNVFTYKFDNKFEYWQAEIKPFQSILTYYDASKIKTSSWSYDRASQTLTFNQDGKDNQYKLKSATDSSFVAEELANGNFEYTFSRAE